MSKNVKRLILVTLALAGVSCLGVGIGTYVITDVYPAWINERFKTEDRVDSAGGVERTLMIGTVNHGTQFLKPSDRRLVGDPSKDFSRLATTYYHRLGPVGRIIETMNWFPSVQNTYWADTRMPASQIGLCATPGGLPLAALVGVWSEPPYAGLFLNNGCLASYARPFQCVDLYERKPAIRDLSLPPGGEAPKFSFVQDAQKRGAHVRIVDGMERQTLADKGPKRFYKVLVVDTSRGRSDLVSQELMTKEAMALFFDLLTDDGILLIHTSNRDYDLPPAVADVALSLGHSCACLLDNGVKGPAGKAQYNSEWVVVVRTEDMLATIQKHVGPVGPNNGILWRPLAASGSPPWVDGGSNGRLRR